MNTDIFEASYKRLNPEQKKAVDTIEGPVMVTAGPGTGKTQILTLRIANILKKTDTEPENILALTFTNAGVFAMRKRLVEIIGDAGYRVGIFTFHSFCEHLIKSYPNYFPDFERAQVVSDLERVQIIENILGTGDFEQLTTFHDPFFFLNTISSGISTIKSEGYNPVEFAERIPGWRGELLSDENNYYKRDYGNFKKGDLKPSEQEKIEKKIAKAAEIAEIFQEYQKALHEKRRYDFSDMILAVLAELHANANLKADVQEQYHYLLIDEHQDTNKGQNQLIELLTDAPHLEGHANIFTVGDANQSIYRFQGASAETFRHFNEVFVDIEHITLVENYRSVQSVLNSAHTLIGHGDDQASAKPLHSNTTEEGSVSCHEYSNYKFELLGLAENIKQKIESGVSPNDIAVIYRGHKYTYDVKNIFDHHQIPYTIFARENIFEDRVVANLMTLLRVVDNPHDNESLGKALLIDFLEIDVYDAVRLLEKFKRMKRGDKKQAFALLESKQALAELGITKTSALGKLSAQIKDLRRISENTHFTDFFKLFLEKTGYLSYMLAAPDSRAQLLKLDKLFDEIKRQSETKQSYGLSDFLAFVDALEKYGLKIETSNPEIVEGVNLMTAHGSKGLEFDHVYILNATRKGWEKSGARNTLSLPVNQYQGDIEDERRLLYVAMTRAKKTLTLSYAVTDDDGRAHEKSEFIEQAEIPVTTQEEFEKKNVDRLYEFVTYHTVNESLFDADYIRELFLRRGLNVSALNNYLDCPKKYLYRNLIQIPSSYSATLAFGNVIHRTLELFFKSAKTSGVLGSQKELLDLFNEAMGGYYFSPKELEKFEKRGMELLQKYYDEHHATWKAYVSTEEYVKRDFSLESGETIALSGVIDKIEYRDESFSGPIQIIDYKTGRTFSEKTKDEKKKYERQIIFYHLLLQNYKEGRVTIDQSILDFVEMNKKNEFEQYSFEVTDDHLQQLKAEINQMTDEIFSLEFLQKGCGKKTCEWCALG